MKSVYSAVRTGSLNKAVCASSLEGLKKLDFGIRFGKSVVMYNRKFGQCLKNPGKATSIIFTAQFCVPQWPVQRMKVPFVVNAIPNTYWHHDW